MSDAPKLKDYFTPKVVRQIGEQLASHHAGFDMDRFGIVVDGESDDEPFEDLAFTARSRRIADGIEAAAGLEPIELLDLLVRSLPPELDGTEGTLNDGFSLWPYGDVIARHGPAYPDQGLATCLELTKRFTSEFAIRPILASSEAALDVVAGWTGDGNEHVRRLVSEGTRPRLPWAARLDLPLDQVLAMLSDLRADPSPYVRKSVANHLNDLAKDHPDRIIDLLTEWHGQGKSETQWIVRHALRNHLKIGTPRALALFGYHPPSVDVTAIEAAPQTVVIGETVDFSFTLVSTAAKSQRLMVDVVVGYMKANGKPSPKVFKFRDIELAGQGDEHCTTSYAMVNRSTRKLYPGTHTLTIRANGQDLASTSFELRNDG